MNCNLIFDMGGVLMQHNMRGCIAAFEHLMGKEPMQKVLGLGTDGEGASCSLMEDFECGRVTEQTFIDTIIHASHAGTTAQEVIDAWNMMHAGIPQERLDQISRWHDLGAHVLLLSNSNSIHKRDLETNYDLSMFDYSFYSHLIHAHKPERAIYEAVETYLIEQGRNQLPTFFVDDIAVNRQAGERFGWTTYASIDELAQEIN